VDTGLSGLAFRLFGGDIPESGMEPLTIVVSFDVGEQVVPGGIPVWVASLVHEFSFQCAEATSIGALPSADYSIELRSTEPLIGFAQQFPFRLMD
jgi:hypothetical protein